MSRYVFYFNEIDKSSLAGVGGKGANLGELRHIPGIAVPAGFCVVTRAYTDFVNTSEEFAALLESLELIDVESLEELKAAGQRMRTHLETLIFPPLSNGKLSRPGRQFWSGRSTGIGYCLC